ncbi:MAG: NAD(P)/FAD-dependent oxidoreductase [Clostridia bacterium]|nr:NAD(P)/FAD-dependent oxidoreductase [Clostridia bacterium]
MYDVIIIGGGVCGCAIARELSRYQTKVGLIEKHADLCEGTSKANSGIVHAGHDAKPGTLKAQMNVRGSRIMEELSKTLDFSYQKNGSLVLCFDEEKRPELNRLLDQGIQNGVRNLRIIEQDELRHLEPNIHEQAVAALYAPEGGIVCPFELTIALAENAYENGVTFKFGTQVTDIQRESELYCVKTTTGTFSSRAVVNAAGVYADLIHQMVCKTPLNIIPRKGEYCLFDKQAGQLVAHTIFRLPTEKGKGVLVTPTVHGNLLVGPNANEQESKDDISTSSHGIQDILSQGAQSVNSLPLKQVITSFAGLRAHESGGDFILEESKEASRFFEVAGISSPGLSAAPAIGEYIAALVRDSLGLEPKQDFRETRKGIFHMATASLSKQQEQIKKDAAYGRVICRCEMVTEGEILDAIHRPLGATTLDGVKRRTRTGMGRCQAGFCSPKVHEILERELRLSPFQVTKSGGGSYLLCEDNKDSLSNVTEDTGRSEQ